jgi:predicted DNA-binding transcriptional regulator AlpA
MTAGDSTDARPLAGKGDGIEPLLVTASEAARLCGVSRAKWFQMTSAGDCPRPVNLGIRCPRWRRHELIAWCEAGCPRGDDSEASTRKEVDQP